MLVRLGTIVPMALSVPISIPVHLEPIDLCLSVSMQLPVFLVQEVNIVRDRLRLL